MDFSNNNPPIKIGKHLYHMIRRRVETRGCLVLSLYQCAHCGKNRLFTTAIVFNLCRNSFQPAEAI